MTQPSFVGADDTLILWTFLIVWATLSIFFEQRYKWGERLSGVVIALLGGLTMSNLGILPIESPVYDTVWEYVVPISIPLLLMQCDLKKIWRETGRMLGAFHVSALGTIVGALTAAALFGSLIPFLAEICGIMTASYIGGAMNFLASVNIFAPPEELSNAVIVADNLVMAVHIMAMLALPSFAFAYRWFRSLPDEELYDNDELGAEKSSSYWRAKPISLVDIGKNLSLSFIIVTVGTKISVLVEASSIVEPFRTFLGNKYLLFSTLTVVFVAIFPRFSRKLRGTQEMGTFAIFLFFVLIGIPASIRSILVEAPALLLLCTLIVAINVLVTFGIGRLFGFSLQEMILASIANTAGPMNAAAIAISKKWTKLILPAFLVGIWGYVIGTYLGVAVGRFLQSIL
jgi:uncharacterized membrane protein